MSFHRTPLCQQLWPVSGAASTEKKEKKSEDYKGAAFMQIKATVVSSCTSSLDEAVHTNDLPQLYIGHVL